MRPERRQALGDAAGGRPWQEGSNGETLQTDLSETSERTGPAAEATTESRATAPSPTAPGRCRRGAGQISLGDRRPPSRSAAGTRAGRSCQRVDLSSATTGVMGHGSKLATISWLIVFLRLRATSEMHTIDVWHALEHQVCQHAHACVLTAPAVACVVRDAGSPGWLHVAMRAARLWVLGC
jgi:hypothetical protein